MLFCCTLGEFWFRFFLTTGNKLNCFGPWSPFVAHPKDFFSCSADREEPWFESDFKISQQDFSPVVILQQCVSVFFSNQFTQEWLLMRHIPILRVAQKPSVQCASVLWCEWKQLISDVNPVLFFPEHDRHVEHAGGPVRERSGVTLSPDEEKERR